MRKLRLKELRKHTPSIWGLNVGTGRKNIFTINKVIMWRSDVVILAGVCWKCIVLILLSQGPLGELPFPVSCGFGVSINHRLHIARSHQVKHVTQGKLICIWIRDFWHWKCLELSHFQCKCLKDIVPYFQPLTSLESVVPEASVTHLLTSEWWTSQYSFDNPVFLA